MNKRIISVLLTLIMFCSTLAVSADTSQIIVNEVFDDYALNETVIQNGTVSGIDARIVERNGKDKAAYGKVWGSRTEFAFPLGKTSDKMVFSYDIKIKGDKPSGSVLKLGTVSFLNYNKDGSIQTEDKYKIGGYTDNVWENYTFIIDFSRGIYNIYVDGKLKMGDWFFASNITTPTQFALSFIPASKEAITEVCIDNVRVYSGDKILKNGAFPAKKSSQEVLEFIPTEKIADDYNVYINTQNEKGLSPVEMNQKENTIVKAEAMNGESKYIHMLQTGTNDCYANVKTGIEKISRFIYEVSVFPVVFETSSVNLCRLIDNKNEYSSILGLSANGVLTSNGNTIGNIPFGKWTSIQVKFDLGIGLADIYINGAVAKTSVALHNGGKNPTFIRIGLNSAKTAGRNEIWLDKIKVYGGEEFIVFDDVIEDINNRTLKSQHDQKSDTIKVLDKDIIYMPSSDYLFADGAKHHYFEYGVRPYTDDDGIVMIPEIILEKTLSIEIKSDGKTITAGEKKIAVDDLETVPVEKEGITYYPVASLCEKGLKAYVYRDVRGFVIVSDNDRGYANSEIYNDNMEEIDVIYRYMQFERPNGEELYKDIVSNSYQQHPRLFIKKDEIPALREKVQNNETLKNTAKTLLKTCDGYIGTPPVAYVIQDELRLFSSCIAVRNKIFDLSTAYILTNDDKYAQRIWDELQGCLNWKDWNVTKHYLDAGKIGPGIAMAYDVLYDWLTDEQKKFIRERVTDLFLDYAVGVYTGESLYKTKGFVQTGSNWGAVCSTSMLFVSLSFIDEEPDGTEFTEKCKFLASNALQSLEYAIGNLAPDGGIADGIGYWEYYIEHTAWSIKAIQNMTGGKDYGFLSSQGYDISLYYGMHIQTPKNGSYNHSESAGTGTVFPPEVFLIADFYGDNKLMQTLETYRRAINVGTNARYILWYQPSEIKGNTNIPLDKYFKGQRIVTMRSSWEDDNATYVGSKVGKNTSLLSHFDKGSFIYEALGERWFVDSGMDNKNITGGYYGASGFTLYVKRAEGHNVAVINPKPDDPGQTFNGIADLISLESKPKGCILYYDLSGVYQGHADAYKRGFFYGDNRNTLIVQDELELTENNSDFFWFLHTYADTIEVAEDGKSAVLSQNGKQLRAEFYCDIPGYRLEAVDSKPLTPEITREGEYSRGKLKVLRIHGVASGKVNVSAKLIPIEEGYNYPSYTYVPMDTWKIPDGELKEKPKLDTLTYNGKSIENFVAGIKEYKLVISFGSITPVFTATSSTGDVVIKQPADIYDNCIITVTNDEGKSVAYTVSFELIYTSVNDINTNGPVNGLPEDVKFIDMKSFAVSDEPQPDNSGKNAFDGDLYSRWSSDKTGAYLEADLGEVKPVRGIALGFMLGSKREYYYQIMVSNDKENYTIVYEGKSTGKTDGWEFLLLKDVAARYVRYVGNSSNENKWNSITEFRPCEDK